MIHRDLRATLSYETKGALDRTGTELIADGRRIPGWYVRVYMNEGYTDIYKYTRLTDDQAAELAKAFDNAAAPPGFPNGMPASAHVKAINAELARGKRERLEQLPSLIAELEDEQRRLTNEVGE